MTKSVNITVLIYRPAGQMFARRPSDAPLQAVFRLPENNIEYAIDGLGFGKITSTAPNSKPSYFSADGLEKAHRQLQSDLFKRLIQTATARSESNSPELISVPSHENLLEVYLFQKGEGVVPVTEDEYVLVESQHYRAVEGASKEAPWGIELVHSQFTADKLNWLQRFYGVDVSTITEQNASEYSCFPLYDFDGAIKREQAEASSPIPGSRRVVRKRYTDHFFGRGPRGPSGVKSLSSRHNPQLPSARHGKVYDLDVTVEKNVKQANGQSQPQSHRSPRSPSSRFAPKQHLAGFVEESDEQLVKLEAQQQAMRKVEQQYEAMLTSLASKLNARRTQHGQPPLVTPEMLKFHRSSAFKGLGSKKVRTKSQPISPTKMQVNEVPLSGKDVAKFRMQQIGEVNALSESNESLKNKRQPQTVSFGPSPLKNSYTAADLVPEKSSLLSPPPFLMRAGSVDSAIGGSLPPSSESLFSNNDGTRGTPLPLTPESDEAFFEEGGLLSSPSMENRVLDHRSPIVQNSASPTLPVAANRSGIFGSSSGSFRRRGLDRLDAIPKRPSVGGAASAATAIGVAQGKTGSFKRRDDAFPGVVAQASIGSSAGPGLKRFEGVSCLPKFEPRSEHSVFKPLVSSPERRRDALGDKWKGFSGSLTPCEEFSEESSMLPTPKP